MASGHDDSTKFVRFGDEQIVPMKFDLNRRCCNLNCRYVTSLPANKRVVNCDCGLSFCSESCRAALYEYGHKFSCRHIKAVLSGVSPLGDLSVYEAVDKMDNQNEENEESLPRIEDMTLKGIKAELQGYKIDFRTWIEVDEFRKALHNARSIKNPCTTASTERNDREATARINKNLSYPSVFWRGQLSTRRFRIGQRIEMALFDGYPNGTIVEYGYNYPAGENVMVYEVETDKGFYASAPMDDDCCIRRLKGTPVVMSKKSPIPEELLPAVLQELQSGLPRCTMARAHVYHGSDYSPPTLDKYRCAGCGKCEERMTGCKGTLSVCAKCRTAAYCDSNCQRKHWPEHKNACNAVSKAREELIRAHPYAKQSKHGRQFIRATTKDLSRFETMQTYLQQTCGMPYGGARMTASLLNQAEKELIKKGSLHDFAQALVYGDFESIQGAVLVNLESLFCLVAAVLHFYETAPDLAALSAVGVDMFCQFSKIKPITLEKPLTGRDLQELEKSQKVLQSKVTNKKKKKGKRK